MATKSSVSNIFPQFKELVENRFNKKIKTPYSDNGGEFVTLKTFLSHHGITHYTTAPYTPQQNGVFAHRYRHLVETSLTLLHDASLPLSFWPHAFRIATYLINRQPIPLHYKSSFKLIFGQQPNYLKLRKFGSLYYPLTKLYNTHKLHPKSIPSTFIRYSQTKIHISAWTPKLIKPTTHRMSSLMRPSPFLPTSKPMPPHSQIWLKPKLNPN